MDQAKKAALFSAMLFPGWGQIYLKQYLRGVVFVVSVLTGTLFLALQIIFAGKKIIQAAPFQKGTAQFSDVVGVSVKSLQTIDLKLFFLLAALLIVLWILSIIDAYILGKKLASSPMTEPTTVVDPESSSDQAQS